MMMCLVRELQSHCGFVIFNCTMIMWLIYLLSSKYSYHKYYHKKGK